MACNISMKLAWKQRVGTSTQNIFLDQFFYTSDEKDL